jgi:hypothetical protein
MMNISRKMLWYQWMDYLATAGASLLLTPVVRTKVSEAPYAGGIVWQAIPLTVLLALPFFVLLCLSLAMKRSAVLRAVLQILLLALVLTQVACVEGGRVEQTRKQESFANATTIIADLQAYHERHSCYPDSLATLEAELGHGLPGPAPGWHFDYRQYDDRFSLAVSDGLYWREYLSAEDRWGFF